MTEAPLVSVLTPTYEGAAFVAETIDSVLAQTYTPIEHVLVDDGSTDGTAAILEDYARRYPDRVRVRAFAERAGPCRRRNDALGLAGGSIIAWLDHDDLWLPEKIQRQVEALRADPGAGFAYTQWETFDDRSGAPLERSDLRADGPILRALFAHGCFIASSTVIVRREAMERRGLRFRDSHFSFGDDYFLWLALSLDWRGARVDDVLTRLRRHERNESDRLAEQNFYLATIALLDEFLHTFPDASEKLGPARRAGFATQYAAAAVYEHQHGRPGQAARYAGRAAAIDPASASRYALRRARRKPPLLRRPA